jgi:preprotein translocase subunit SecF
MEFFRDTKIDFIGKRYVFIAISGLLLAASVFAFVKNKGPVLGIEFTGGTLLQVGFKELPPIDEVRRTLNEAGFPSFNLQTQPAHHSMIIKVKGDDKPKDDVAYGFMEALKKAYPGNVSEQVERVEYIGPIIGKRLVRDTYFAIFLSLLGICIYVAFRFKNWVWGVAGVLALGHDVFLSWGLLTLLGRETTLVVVAALLTLAGYSINDTIVIFDRVRENLRGARKETNYQLYNRSLNETLGRTINTSVITLITALVLYFWGGEVIHDFALVMSFGIIVGSYSTIGVALGLVYEYEERKKRKRA